MAISFQVHQHIVLFVNRLLVARNDLQVLRDRINDYQSNSGSRTDRQNAEQAMLIDSGPQGINACEDRIGLLVAFVDTNLTASQKNALVGLAEQLYGTAAKDDLLSIYQGMKGLASTLQGLARPSRSINVSYATAMSEAIALPAAIDAIPYVELGVSPI